MITRFALQASVVMTALFTESARRQPSLPIAGCWHADRPLGPTGGVEPVARDSAFRTFVLQDSGRVAIPVISEGERWMWEGRSSWAIRDDSVTLRVFTGLQGWDARLARTPDGRSLRGMARYLSDVVVLGRAPTVVPVTLTRVLCEASWPSVATTAPSLRPWQRGERLFVEQQVDRPAVRSTHVSLPEDIVAVRALRYDEHAKLDANEIRTGVARVVLQFVVESDGRVDTSSIKVLASDGAEYTARVRR
ncbi:MAG: hypothetical protein ABMA00_14130, partial [Gemmatimonas sp.]